MEIPSKNTKRLSIKRATFGSGVNEKLSFLYPYLLFFIFSFFLIKDQSKTKNHDFDKIFHLKESCNLNKTFTSVAVV